MPLESGTTISSLDLLWPLSSDLVLSGDDHLRLIKAVLKAQFPGVGGDGFAIAITATEAEINYLSGVTSNIQTQIDAITASTALVAPAGTALVFYQAAPPTGWTQQVANNDAMLRVVSSAGAGTGGTDSPITFTVADHLHTTAAHTLTTAEMPSHTHQQIGSGQDWDQSGVQTSRPYNSSTNAGAGGTTNCEFTLSAGSGGSHTHGDTSTVSGNTFAPKYINVITATKD